MKNLLFCAIMFCSALGVSRADGVLAYRGKLTYKVFTGVEKLKGRLDLILLRQAVDLDANLVLFLIDKKRELAWVVINTEVEISQENLGDDDLEVLFADPDISFEDVMTETFMILRPGGYAKVKSLKTGIPLELAAQAEEVTVDAFKSMPLRGSVFPEGALHDDDEGEGIGWCTGSLRYNRKLTKDLNNDPEVQGETDAATEFLVGDLEDDGFDVDEDGEF